MKYTIEGFNQKKLVEFGLNITDAIILRWYVDFLPKMAQITHNGVSYTWVKYQAIIDDLPAIEITNKQVIARRFDKLIDAGIMEKYLSKDGGSFTCFRLTQKYLELVSTVEVSTQQSIPVDSTVNTPIDSKVDTKDSSTNLNSSISTPLILYEFWQNRTGKNHNSENAKNAAMKFINTALKQYDLETLQNIIEWYCTNPHIEKQYHGIENIFRGTKMQEKVLKVDEWLARSKQHTVFSNNKKPQYEEVGDFSMYDETNSIQYLNGEKFDTSTITNWDEVPEHERPF